MFYEQDQNEDLGAAQPTDERQEDVRAVPARRAGLARQIPHIRNWGCVVLDASDAKFEEAKIAHPEAVVVCDAGLTEVPAGSETAIAWYEDDPDQADG